jgi:hypothetical protein
VAPLEIAHAWLSLDGSARILGFNRDAAFRIWRVASKPFKVGMPMSSLFDGFATVCRFSADFPFLLCAQQSAKPLADYFMIVGY